MSIKTYHHTLLGHKKSGPIFQSIRIIPFLFQNHPHPFSREGRLSISGRSSDSWFNLVAAPSHHLSKLTVAVCSVRPQIQRRARSGFKPDSLLCLFRHLNVHRYSKLQKRCQEKNRNTDKDSIINKYQIGLSNGYRWTNCSVSPLFFFHFNIPILVPIELI